MFLNTQTKRIAQLTEKLAKKPQPDTKYDNDIKRIADALEYIVQNGGTIGGGGCDCANKFNDYYDKTEFDELIADYLRSNPVILNVNHMLIEEGSSFNPMEKVQALDHEGDDITHLVTVSGTVDVDTPGEYTLTYSVMDDKGKSTTVERIVTVEEWNINNYATVLFTDGHFMINEKKANRDADEAIHGAVLNEYAPWDKKNPDTSYVFTGVYECPWSDELESSIFSVSAGSVFKPRDCSHYFEMAYELQTVDTNNWDVRHMTNAVSMFSYCQKLKNIDVTNWNTGSLIDASYMFSNCSSLNTLCVSNWNTENITNTNEMFYGCSSLTVLDVSLWDTGKLQNASFMFSGCSALNVLDVSRWDTKSMAYATSMFNGDGNLEQIDVSNWNTSNLLNTQSMFANCPGLTLLDLSQWDTTSLAVTKYMFDSCSGLINLYLSDWNTIHFDDIACMFINCSSITNLDLSSWDTNSVRYISSIFKGCSNLTTIYASSRFNVSHISTGSRHKDMFLNCASLIGGAGTPYNGAKTDKTYARIDNPPSEPGYFTLKP